MKFWEINEKYTRFASYILSLFLFEEASIAKRSDSSEIEIILFEICPGNPCEFFCEFFWNAKFMIEMYTNQVVQVKPDFELILRHT